MERMQREVKRKKYKYDFLKSFQKSPYTYKLKKKFDNMKMGYQMNLEEVENHQFENTKQK